MKEKQFAFALYENQAESEDELTFRKNDILQILQRDYLGMEGWWLCSLTRTGFTGLAAGNRLRPITDKKTLAKIHTMLANTGSVITSSSSICSVISNSSNTSSRTSSSASSNVSCTSESFAEVPESKPCIVLPAKLSKSKTPFITKSTENILSIKSNALNKNYNNNDNKNEDDDDYDYDIPANRPVINETESIIEDGQSSDQEKESQVILQIDQTSTQSNVTLEETKTSTIDNVDSHMSRLSLSLKSDDSATSTSSNDTSITSATDNLALDFSLRTNQLCIICSDIKIFKSDITSSRQKLCQLKELIYAFLVHSLKRVKEEHACFHPDLHTFNNFKTLYRQMKEFYLYLDSSYGKITKVQEILAESELTDVLSKISYFEQLISDLQTLVQNSNIFNYHSQISITKYQSSTAHTTNQDYEYEYDNNPTTKISSSAAPKLFDYDIYEQIDDQDDYSDYCQITEANTEVDALPSLSSLPTPSSKQQQQQLILPKQQTSNLFQHEQIYSEIRPECLTLRKSEERIKREIKLSGVGEKGGDRVNLVDQMLLKFYLRHIEENLDELNDMYQQLMTRLNAGESVEDDGHKLAINGHKLVFICDTLERNLTNTHLKTALHETSSGMCESLRLYMIRLKTTSLVASNDQTERKQRLVIEALQSVLTTSNKFKQVIIKYYFKSY